MALGTPIDRGTASRGYSSANVVSASFTPAANSLLLCWGASQNAISSITGHDGAGTWEVLATATQSMVGALWACHVGGSPSASTVSVAFPSTFPSQINVVEITGADVSGTVQNSFAQIVATSGYGTLLSISLPGATSLTVGGWASRDNKSLTPEGTLINLLNHPNSTREAATDYNLSGDTTPTCALSSSGPGVGVAVEIKAGGGGGAPTGIPILRRRIEGY